MLCGNENYSINFAVTDNMNSTSNFVFVLLGRITIDVIKIHTNGCKDEFGPTSSGALILEGNKNKTIYSRNPGHSPSVYIRINSNR